MLKALFSSGTRVKILNIFLLSSSDKEYFIRELTRLLDEQINSIRRELENLKKIGLLKSRNRDRRKYYRVNTDFIFYNELQGMFRKGAVGGGDIAKRIDSFGKVNFLLFSGLFAGKEDGIDIFIVGDIDKEKLNAYISKELQFEREIKYSSFSQEEFFYRIDCRDKFVNSLLNNQDNIIAIDRIGDMSKRVKTNTLQQGGKSPLLKKFL